MILEILFLSLAIRSYGNKFEYYETVKASENDKSNFKLETNASWPGNEYKLNEKSSCINKDGQKEENDLEFSDVSNQYATIGNYYQYCIPYDENTKHLVGTTDEAPEYYRYWED